MINEVTRILMSDTPLAISENGYRYLLSLAYPKVEQQSSTPSSESATVPRSYAARPSCAPSTTADGARNSPTRLSTSTPTTISSSRTAPAILRCATAISSASWLSPTTAISYTPSNGSNK